MAVLKVNTTAAPGETPMAPLLGIVETIVGCAVAWRRPPSNIVMAKSQEVRFGFWKRINERQPEVGSVTGLTGVMSHLMFLNRERIFVFIVVLSSAC